MQWGKQDRKQRGNSPYRNTPRIQIRIRWAKALTLRYTGFGRAKVLSANIYRNQHKSDRNTCAGEAVSGSVVHIPDEWGPHKVPNAH